MPSGEVAWIHADLARWWKAELASDSERPPWKRSSYSLAEGKSDRNDRRRFEPHVAFDLRPFTGGAMSGATGGTP